jgi:hypothetical protein
MTDQFEDETLRRRFGELRQQEESQRAPEFDDVLTRALSRQRVPAHSSSRMLAAAAAVVLALGLGWIALRPHGGALRRRDASNVSALSQWQSPTAFLLEGPSDSLLRTIPTITIMPPELRSVLRAGAQVQEKRS